MRKLLKSDSLTLIRLVTMHLKMPDCMSLVSPLSFLCDVRHLSRDRVLFGGFRVLRRRHPWGWACLSGGAPGSQTPLKTVCFVQFCTLDFNIHFPFIKSILVFQKFQNRRPIRNCFSKSIFWESKSRSYCRYLASLIPKGRYWRQEWWSLAQSTLHSLAHCLQATRGSASGVQISLHKTKIKWSVYYWPATLVNTR